MQRHRTPVFFFLFFFGADKAQNDTEKKRKKKEEKGKEKKTTRSFFKHLGRNNGLLVEIYPIGIELRPCGSSACERAPLLAVF